MVIIGKVYEQVCSTYKCGNIYPAISEYSTCPQCGISEYEIHVVGSNDRNIVRNYDWRMEFKKLEEK